MKLSVKIALSVVLIVALAVSLSGYFLISSGFQSQLNSQVAAMEGETRLLCAAMGTMATQELRETPGVSLDDILKDAAANVFFSPYDLTLTKEETVEGDTVRYVISTVERENGTAEILAMSCRFSVDGTAFRLENRRDISALYRQRTENLRIYRRVFLLAVAGSLLLGFATGAVLTAPVRSLARSTRRIAAGQYSVRAKIRGMDEIGELAGQFNHMADNLQAHMESLEQAAQKQKDFTAAFAHELKTPLTSIIGYADTLRSRRLTDAQRFEAASFIFSEGKRLEDMSYALLHLFSLDNAEPEMRVVSTARLADAVEESCRYSLMEARLILENQVEDARVTGEPQLLMLLLYNLIDNARKASEPGSKITLGAAVQKRAIASL